MQSKSNLFHIPEDLNNVQVTDIRDIGGEWLELPW